MSAPGPTGERQDTSGRPSSSFAGDGQSQRLFRGFDSLTIRRAICDLLEESRFLLNTQLVFFKKEKDPISKQFDDDEWIRSLTEAQEITADVPKDSVMYDQQAVDPKKVRPIQVGEFLRKYVSRGLSRAQRRRNCSSHDSNASSSELDPKAVLRLSPSSVSSSTMNGRQDP